MNFWDLKSAGSEVAAVYRECVNSRSVLLGRVFKNWGATGQSRTKLP